jgi:hypothetical protein
MGGPSKKRHRAAQYSIVVDARADRLKAQVEALARQPLPTDGSSAGISGGGPLPLSGRMGLSDSRSGGDEMQAPSLVQCLSGSNAHATAVYHSYCMMLLQELNQQKEAFQGLARENHMLRLKLGISNAPVPSPAGPTALTADAMRNQLTMPPSSRVPDLHLSSTSSATEGSVSRGSSPVHGKVSTSSDNLGTAASEQTPPAKKQALAAAPESKSFEGFVPLTDLGQCGDALRASSSSGTLGTLRPNLSSTSLKSLGLKTDLLGDDFLAYVFASTPNPDSENQEASCEF